MNLSLISSLIHRLGRYLALNYSYLDNRRSRKFNKNESYKSNKDFKSNEDSHSQPPMKSSGMNLLKVSLEDQNKLINILKCHTQETTKSLSPQRQFKTPLTQRKFKNFEDRSEVKPNGIRAVIDASKFFTKPKVKAPQIEFQTPKSDVKFLASPKFNDVELKAVEIEANCNQTDQNKQLLEFIQVVKKKFNAMEIELEKSKTDLIYYKRKSLEQAEIIEDLRKRER